MTEAVIVATAQHADRTHVQGCTGHGPDDLSAHIITSVLDKVPALDRTEIEDVLGAAVSPAVSPANIAPGSGSARRARRRPRRHGQPPARRR